jgi:ribosome biogenesis GTPase
VIDTPGVRSFGVAHVNIQRVIGAFSEFADVINLCPKNCSHNDQSCALNTWQGFDASQHSRLSSLRRLLASD